MGRRVVTWFLLALVGIGALVFAPTEVRSEPLVRVWSTGQVYDQGPYPTCVGAAFEAMLEADPFPAYFNYRTIYNEAQKIDPWHDEPHDGTDLESAAQILVERHYLDNYFVSDSPVEAANWIAQRSPVILAMPWRSRYYRDIAPDGYYSADGYILGWHALMLYGFDSSGQATGKDGFWVQQSWGRYGVAANGHDTGQFFMHAWDVERLVGEGAYFVLPLKRIPAFQFPDFVNHYGG